MTCVAGATADVKTTDEDLPLFMDDPDWAAFIPVLPSGGAKCGNPSHEDCSPLDVTAVARHLEPGGTLGRMKGYEPRPGQIDMLRAVTRAFNDRRHLMVEAGTGVGKSLAYLVPSVLWSFVNDTPVVLSTATRNLQSQLVGRDLPRAATVLGADASKFRAAVLKGRTNYLCLRALGDFMQNGYFALTEQEKVDLVRLVDWLRTTSDGDLDTVDAGTLRMHVSCPGEDCQGRTCPYQGKCFVRKARDKALHAHVVVANHALVLAEAISSDAGLLPAYGRLVFDEAHNLEDIATDFFSSELSRPVLLQLLGRLSRVSKSRRGTARTRGVLGSVERQLQKGALRDVNQAAAIRDCLTAATTQARLVMKTYDDLADVMEGLFRPAPRQDILRYRCAPHRQYALNGLFADYLPGAWEEDRLWRAARVFEDALARLQATLGRMANALSQSASDELPLFGDLVMQSQTLSDDFKAFIQETKFVLSGSDPSHVYWIEKCPGKSSVKQPPYVRLVAAPLSVADQMKRYFYDAKDSVVLCSATLRTGDKFNYMARKLGVAQIDENRVSMLVAASPFDYFRQACVLAPSCLPDPSAQKASYVDALGPFLVDLFTASHGRGLVLFTAYDMMRDVAGRVRPAFEAQGIHLLVQGDGVSREAMTQTLKDAGKQPVVLFGAQSFWEGVDVPGAVLSCVVLARLPFPQVGEPIVEARCEKIEETGGSQFRDYMLPEAIIRFRQGFGRLVRTKTDRGVVVVADPRIATKNYGMLFKRSIAVAVHVVPTLDETLARARTFFEEA